MIDIDILLEKGATYKVLAPDEVLFNEGTPCSFYHQLVAGKIKWGNISDDGREFIQEIVNEGECIADIPLFNKGTYATTATAVSNCTVIRLHSSSFDVLLKEKPELLLKFTQLLARMLSFKLQSLKDLAYHDPEHRILSMLNHLQDSQHNICPKCSKLQLTRQQIAAMTGMRVETVIRAMRHLHQKGELTISKGKVYCSAGDLNHKPA